MDTKEIKEAKWTKEEVAEHLRINLIEKAGSYSAEVVVAALYKMLYGEFPKIGLSVPNEVREKLNKMWCSRHQVIHKERKWKSCKFPNQKKGKKENPS